MKSKINVIILAIGLFFLILPLGIFGQDPEPTSNPFAKLKVFSVLSAPPQVIPEKRTWSPIREGLKLCPVLTNQSFNFNLGDWVFLNLSLENMTEQEIIIFDTKIKYNDDSFRFHEPYSFIIFGPDGKKMLTKTEELAKQVNEGTQPQSKLIEQLPINSGPKYRSINPKQKLHVEVSLSRYYDFKFKGTYQIFTTLKIPEKNGNGLTRISISIIEIEIN